MTTSRQNRRDYDLRDWLYQLDSTNRLAVIKPGALLKFELAGIANRLDGRQASYFPKPSGHNIPVVSGLISDRAWMAEALGLEVVGDLARASRRSTAAHARHALL